MSEYMGDSLNLDEGKQFDFITDKICIPESKKRVNKAEGDFCAFYQTKDVGEEEKGERGPSKHKS